MKKLILKKRNMYSHCAFNLVIVRVESLHVSICDTKNRTTAAALQREIEDACFFYERCYFMTRSSEPLTLIKTQQPCFFFFGGGGGGGGGFCRCNRLSCR